MWVRGNRAFPRIGAALLLGFAAASAVAAEKGSLGDEWAKAFKAGDLDGVMKLYAKDAVGWFPGEAEARGADAIRATYKSWFDAFTIVDVKLTNEHRESDGKHSAGWGNYSMTIKSKTDGKTSTSTGRYTDITELRGKQWFYIVDHASEDPPPPKPAAAGK
jgi:ketosteroid isomerase-like protein